MPTYLVALIPERNIFKLASKFEKSRNVLKTRSIVKSDAGHTSPLIATDRTDSMKPMNTRPHPPKLSKRRRGAAMVEMAVCFPIFMLMLLGIIEFGRALMVSQLLTAAAREGCRVAIIDGATEGDVETEIRNMVTGSVGCQTTAVQVDIVVTAISNGAIVNDLANADQRDLIKIDITVPFSAVSITAGRFLNGNNLRGQCAMRKE